MGPLIDMYGTYVNAHPDADLARLDVALLALRRLVAAPGGGLVLRHAGGRVEVSTMLVVEAVARSLAAGVECTVGGVAEALHVAHSTASRLVDRAAKAGMVRRTRAANDPRRTRVVLTTEGEHLQGEAVRFRTGRLAHILGSWTAEEVVTFTDLLERFAADARGGLHGPADPIDRPPDPKTPHPSARRTHA